MSPTIFGVDYASYQQGESLSENAGEGFRFAYIKATQGASYIDPAYAGWAANPGGMLVIPYHFATTETPAAQAAHFKAVAGPVPAMMLDFEHGAPTSAAGTLEVIEAFTGAGYVVDAYLPRWWWDEIGRPDMAAWPIRNLVASSYASTSPGYASALYPGDDYEGWEAYGNLAPTVLQFTDTAVVGGRHVDADAAKSMSVFDVPGAPGAPATPAPPAPVAPAAPAGWAATVRTVQTELNRWPFSRTLPVDGEPGPDTAAALRAFQRAAGLAVDAVPGPLTYRKLTAWYDPNRPQLQQGATGSAVTWLQTELNRVAGPLARDARFGPATEASLRRAQLVRGLEVDGVAGRETNAALQL
jgi:lysozyme